MSPTPSAMAGKKVSDPICAKHPKGRFPATRVRHLFFRLSLVPVLHFWELMLA